MKIRLEKSPEAILCQYIAMVVLFLFLTNLSSGLSAIFGFSAGLVSNILKIILGILFLFRFPTVIRRFDKHLLIFSFCAVLVALFNYALFPKLITYFQDTLIYFFSVCLTTYIVCYQIRDYKLLTKKITKVSYIIVALSFLLLIGIFTGPLRSFNNNKYSMGLGYSCIIPAIFLSIDAVQNKRVLSVISVIFFAIFIITVASRGPLIELFLFISFFPIRNFFNQKKYIKGMLLIIGIILILVFYKELLLLFGTILQKKGIQNRVVRTMTAGTLYLSGRDELYEVLIPEIMKNPLRIRGINAEYAVLGVYAHNFIVELIYQLGLVIGGSIIIFILWRIGKTAGLKDIDSQETVCIGLMFACVPQLLVSSSLWTNHVFWMWMAVSSKLVHVQKKKMIVNSGDYHS